MNKTFKNSHPMSVTIVLVLFWTQTQIQTQSITRQTVASLVSCPCASFQTDLEVVSYTLVGLALIVQFR